MNILIVNTGNEKLDTAYKNMQVHISGYETFESFNSYFKSVVKTEDYEYLSTWLLKVLHHEFRHGRTENKHDFDLLLEKVSPEQKAKLERWLEEQLEKIGGK